MANFGLGGVVFISTDNGVTDTMKVKAENDQWYSNNKKKPDLYFNTRINGKTIISVYGAEGSCCDGKQRYYFKKAANDTEPKFEDAMTEWKPLSPAELGAAVSDDSEKDVFQFFVDKNLSQKSGQPFSLQMPSAAAEEKAPVIADGTGQASSYNGSTTGLQMWYMIDHNDVNRAAATEFGWFMDGTKANARNWASGEPKNDRTHHYVQEDKDGKSHTATREQQYSCITCMKKNTPIIIKGTFTAFNAAQACKDAGADLPKRTSNTQKTHKS